MFFEESADFWHGSKMALLRNKLARVILREP